MTTTTQDTPYVKDLNEPRAGRKLNVGSVIESDAVKKYIGEEHGDYDGIWEFLLNGDLHRRFKTLDLEDPNATDRTGYFLLEGGVSVCKETHFMKGEGVEGVKAREAHGPRIALESRQRRALDEIRDSTSVLTYEMGRGDLSLHSLEGISALLKATRAFLPKRD